MPTLEQMGTSHQSQNPALYDALRQHERTHSSGDVAAELAALREEVAALRTLLAPPSAVILTGAEVERAFAELRRSRPKTAAQMRYDAAHDTSCVGAFARARP